jgi:hypothetical protein
MRKLSFYIVFLFLMFVLLIYRAVMGYEAPPGIEQKPIKGNFRVIEHDAYKTFWVVYDTQRYEEIKDGYILYPPTYGYIYSPLRKKKWEYETYNKPIETLYRKELTVIIPKGREKERKVTEPTLSLDQAVEKFIAPVSSVKKTKRIEEQMVIVLGEKTKLGTEPLWLFKNGWLYCINGAAKELTKNLDYTFEMTPERAYGLIK